MMRFFIYGLCICSLLPGMHGAFGQQPSPKLMLPIGSRLEVLSAQFSPDGKRVVTASADKTAMVWDVETGNLLLILDEHKDIVSYAEYSPDGKRIVTSSYDNLIKVWDAGTGEHLYALKGHKDSVLVAHFSPDGRRIVSASADGTGKLWDAATRRLIADLSGHEAKVNAAQFSPDGKWIVTASANSTVAIWNTRTGDGKYLGDRTDPQHRAAVIAIDFSYDSKYVVTASEDRTAKVWDLASGKHLRTLQKHTDKLNAVKFSPDGSKIVTASRDKTANIWNAGDGRLLLTLAGHTNSIKSAQFSPDGKKIVTTSFDSTARIWDVTSGKTTALLKGHGRTVWSAGFSKDKTKVVTASYDGTAKVWDLATGSLLSDLKGHTNWVYSALFSRDGKKIVTATDDSTIKIWDASNGSLLSNLKGHNDWVFSASFSPDGKRVVSTSRDKTVRIWDVGSGYQSFLQSYRNSNYIILAADYSPDGNKILLTTSKDSLEIIDAVTGKKHPGPIGHPGMLMAKFSSDGRYIITASRDSTAKIWNAASGTLLHTLVGHDDGLLFAAFSPDNTRIVTTSTDRTAIIWDSSGLALDTLIGHSEKIIFAAFSPDSKKVITASEDKTARIWDITNGKLRLTLKGHTDWVNTAMFDATGEKIISASGDNTVKVWASNNGKLLYTFFAVDSTDYLVVDPQNHFDGSENARSLLYFTCGAEKVALDQVKDELWVPGLAEDLNNGKMIRAKTLEQLDVCGLIPEVEAIDNTNSEFLFKITARRGGLGETVLFVNGIEAKRYSKEQLTNVSGEYMLRVRKDSIAGYFIAGEDNWVTLKSYTASNDICSPEAKISIDKDEANVVPNLFAMIVGTSTYKEDTLKRDGLFDANINLGYPAIDANAISKALSSAARKMFNRDGKEHVFVYTLTTDSNNKLQPNKKNIKLVLDSIGKKATANDILLIFFSGHGVMEDYGDRQQFYYMTADASSLLDEKAYPRVAISTDELTEWIRPKNIRAQKRILILDACHSGQAINDMLTTNTQQPRYIITSDGRAEMIKDIDRLNERSGLFILSASASNKTAFESDKYAHGYLTYSLLKAIKQQPDILEDGKTLNISRWFNAAGRSVNEIAKEENNDQKTQIFSVTDFNIGEVDSAVIASISLKLEKPLFTSSNFQSSDSTFVGDELGLTQSLNNVLREISAKGKESKIVFAMSSPAGNTYTLNGSYKIKGNEIKLEIRIKQGKNKLCEFEERGHIDNLKELAEHIINKAMDCISSK